MISSKLPFIRLLAIVSATAILAALLPGCRSTGRSVVYIPPRIALPGTPNQRNVNVILKTAFSQVGNPYRYGGSSPETGFDCSGFVGWVYGQFGVDLPRSSRDMLSIGDPVDRADLRPGDLVFFNYGYSHVGIYTGGDKYLHSPSSGKSVQESNLSDKGRGNRFVGGRRIIDNAGVAAITESLKREWIADSRHQADAEIKAASNKRSLNIRLASAPQASLKSKPPSAKSSSLNSSSAKSSTAKSKAVAPKTANAKAASAKAASGKTASSNPAVAAKPASKKPEAAAKPKTASANPKPKSKNSGSNIHKVVSGDNLVTLARRYGVTVNDIVAANQLTDRHKLKIGQKLKIPGKKNSQTAKNKAKPASGTSKI